ncbi:hypothetical protein S21ZY_087 [Pseudomonas phage ZY21]|nr:hypothetical protein S21ZY_087 [Pseudomonas phage ZY21]
MKILLIGFAALALTGCFDPKYGDEEHARREGKDLNDLRIEQAKKCDTAGMKAILNEDEQIICTPDYGIRRINEFFETKLAEEVIQAELAKRKIKRPENPDSFETKSKVTQ